MPGTRKPSFSEHLILRLGKWSASNGQTGNPRIEQLRPADVQQRLADGWRPLLVDVREAWERELAVLPEEKFETLAVPLGQLPTLLPELLEQMSRGRPLLCLCHHGIRSWHAACMIIQEIERPLVEPRIERTGAGKVFNLAGGIDAWSMETDPSLPRY